MRSAYRNINRYNAFITNIRFILSNKRNENHNVVIDEKRNYVNVKCMDYYERR